MPRPYEGRFQQGARVITPVKTEAPSGNLC